MMFLSGNSFEELADHGVPKQEWHHFKKRSAAHSSEHLCNDFDLNAFTSFFICTAKNLLLYCNVDGLTCKALAAENPAGMPDEACLGD